MVQRSTLQDVIEVLQYGTKYHISIEFFHKGLRNILQLPFNHIVHATPFCDKIKEVRGLNRCIECKRKAMDKARRTGKPYGGLCVNGVYEYCYPVYKSGALICIIFVGNIINDPAAFLQKSGLNPQNPLLDTFEKNMAEQTCFQVCQVLENYILLLSEELPEYEEGKRINPTVAAVQGYVDQYFYLDISLAAIADMYHYNEKYLGALFKKQVGMTFHNYLNERRLLRATTLLKHSNDSVLTISVRVGFNNVTYFNRLFRERFGITPGEYRKTKRPKL